MNRPLPSRTIVRRIQPSSSSLSPSNPLAPLLLLRTAKLANARQRLSLIARHLQPRSFLAINTPFSTERASEAQDDLPYEPLTRPLLEPTTSSASAAPFSESSSTQTEAEARVDSMATASPSAQPPHPTLLIPGPVEYSDEVLASASHYSESHMGPGFAATFAKTLALLRPLFQTVDPAARPLVVSGSGTLGWDFVAANVTEPGERALVLHTGYFADSFADCFETYGVQATQLKAPIGERPSLEDVEAALKKEKYKVLTVTHVDTSTGVLSDVAGVAAVVKRVSPGTLVVVDGVCSVGCEDIQFDRWGLDVVLTASQKAIGAPAGLCIAMVSGRAVEAFERRTKPPGSYFASFKNWMPSQFNPPYATLVPKG